MSQFLNNSFEYIDVESSSEVDSSKESMDKIFLKPEENPNFKKFREFTTNPLRKK